VVRLAAFLLLGLASSGPASGAALGSALDHVDVFTGTSNSRWGVGPGPALPFGMVKLSPDNQGNVWNGGYEYTVGSISGFSHLHGMAISGLSLMPFAGEIAGVSGEPRTFPGPPDGPFGHMWTAGYRSRFDRASEKGSPGYYAVALLDAGVGVELSATTRCGFVRLRYAEGKAARLVVDFGFPTEEKALVREAVLRRTGPSSFEGYARQSNTYTNDFSVYFVVETSVPVSSLDGWQTGRYEGTDTNYGTAWRTPVTWQRGVAEARGDGSSGAVLTLAAQGDEPVVVRTALSFVSIEGARRNLEAEARPFGWDFDAVVASARQAWAGILGRVEVSGGREEDRRLYYTCLYRAFAGRTIVSDVDGGWTDMCERPRRLAAPATHAFSSDGFWGAQWTLAPLWALVAPEWAAAWSSYFLEAADAGGFMPEAPVDGEYAPIMGAQHHQAIPISAWQKGIRPFEGERLWKAVRHDLTTPGMEHACGGYAGNRHLVPYLEYGYVPDEDGPASNTLEYAFDDWAASQLALALGKKEEAEVFRKRSESWRNLFDPATGYVRRRHRDGSFVEPFDPFRYGTEGGWNGPGFMEGNAWVYTFFVPHDVPGLVALLGRDRFRARLAEGFAKGHVDLSNQPNMQAPFLFNYAGAPWLTQRHSREVLRTVFDLSPLGGWRGEEDEGQMSAFYVLVAMGLFEMDGGCGVSPSYDLSSPLFEKVVLHLDPKWYGGRTFTIEAPGNTERNVYIQSAELDGRPLAAPRLAHADLVKGGRLVLRMGPEPDEGPWPEARRPGR
jgi:predicted alpha-1,2-mannosidase